jgi:hypothetical protein
MRVLFLRGFRSREPPITNIIGIDEHYRGRSFLPSSYSLLLDRPPFFDIHSFPEVLLIFSGILAPRKSSVSIKEARLFVLRAAPSKATHADHLRPFGPLERKRKESKKARQKKPNNKIKKAKERRSESFCARGVRDGRMIMLCLLCGRIDGDVRMSYENVQRRSPTAGSNGGIQRRGRIIHCVFFLVYGWLCRGSWKYDIQKGHWSSKSYVITDCICREVVGVAKAYTYIVL